MKIAEMQECDKKRLRDGGYTAIVVQTATHLNRVAGQVVSKHRSIEAAQKRLGKYQVMQEL